MRCNWRRWLWGVIPLVCVSVVAVHLERKAIERDLTDRARQVLAAGGAYWADVNFSGRDVVLTGSATADNEPPEAEAFLRKVWGVRHVNNNAGLPPKIEPYLWRAHRRGDRVRVYGHVPNRATRQIIIGMMNAALPGLEVTDRMRAGRGVPPMDTWLAGVSFALKQLAALKKGEVRLEGLALTVTGETENAAEYRAVSAALKGGLPKGISLAGMKIAAPVVSPYTWSAQFAGGQLVLSGHVGDDSAKAELMAAAAAAAPAGTDVVDRLEAARGAPADFAAAASALVRQLVKLQSGNAELKETAASIGGVAAGEAQAAAVREALRTSMPAAFKLTDQIRVQEPPKDVRTEPKVERKVEVKPAASAPADQPPAADLRPKVDVQPVVPASPAPTEAQPKVGVEPEVKIVARSPAEAPAALAPQPAPPAAAAAPAEEAQAKVAAASPPAPAPSVPTAGASPAPPPAAPAPAEPATIAPAAPSAPTPPPEAAPAPAAPAAMPAPSPEPAQPSSETVACRDDLAKLAAANPIAFERGSARLDAEGIAMLAKIAAAVKACPGVRIAAEGHTDIEGGPDYNRRLSIKRARVVAACLIENGVGADQVETAGFGSSRPAVPNTTVQARAKNRRAEILVRPK